MAVTLKASPATMLLNTAFATLMVAVVLPSYTLSFAATPDTVMALAVTTPSVAVRLAPVLRL